MDPCDYFKRQFQIRLVSGKTLKKADFFLVLQNYASVQYFKW